jgi:hypothetical protein
MVRHSGEFTLAGAVLLAFLLLNSINVHSVMATRDDQDPNYQIQSSNTSNDYNSWARWSVTTQQSFQVTPSASHYSYTYQMNTLVNGCGSVGGSGCSGTWWLQGVVPAYVAGGGAVVTDAFVDAFVGSIGQGFCHLSPSPNYDVNHAGYVVLQQSTLTDASDITYLLSISDNLGNNLYTKSMPCPYPTSPPYPVQDGPVNFFTREEGVVVGDNGLADASFSPLSSTIFFPFYLDLVSNYNSMSSYYVSPPCPCDTQTGETSNLYQSIGQAYGQSYGSQWLYTIQLGSEITRTDA